MKKILFASLTSLTMLSMTPAVQAQADITRSEVELMIAGHDYGVQIPSQAARAAFGLTEQADLNAYTYMVQHGRINFANAAQVRVFENTLVPALKLIQAMDTQARIPGQDLTEAKQNRIYAYDLISAIGSPFFEDELGGLTLATQTQGSTTSFNRACLVTAVNIAAMAGNRDHYNELARWMIQDPDTGDMFVSVPGGTCRPDANDKICNQTDDPLGNDTCVASTAKYCKLTTRNGHKRCTQASDGAD